MEEKLRIQGGRKRKREKYEKQNCTEIIEMKRGMREQADGALNVIISLFFCDIFDPESS